MSSTSYSREQYGTRLHCARCNSHGYATWETSEKDAQANALGTIVRITPGFFIRGTDKQGAIEIVCLKCNS